MSRHNIRLVPEPDDLTLQPLATVREDIVLRERQVRDGDIALGFPAVSPSEAAVSNDVTGTGSLTFAFSESATGTETFSGTGAVAFGSSLAATGAETFTGSGGVTFAFSESGSGAQTISGSGGLTFLFSEDGTGTVGSSDITGTGGLAFGFSFDGTGTNDSIQPGHGGGRVGGRPHYIVRQPAPTVTILPEPVLPEPIEGDGGVRFGFTIAAIGDTNDDDLAILLAA